MRKWQPIATAPVDGSEVYVRRIHEGHLVKEGLAVFDVPVADAPMLQPFEADPLGRPENFVSEERAAQIIESARSTKRWMNPDRVYAFPQPTHWWPESTPLP